MFRRLAQCGAAKKTLFGHFVPVEKEKWEECNLWETSETCKCSVLHFRRIWSLEELAAWIYNIYII